MMPPKLKSTECKLAFIIGYIDGDGYIGLGRFGCLRLTITGHENILNWIKKEFDFLFPSNRNGLAAVNCIKGADERIKRYSIEGKRAKSILTLLKNYHDIYKLDRKWCLV